MLRDFIPARWRRVVYVVLSTALALEAVWDLVPDGTESRLLATLAALGFGLAAGNTVPAPTEED